MTTNRTMRIGDEDWEALLQGALDGGYRNRTEFVVALARSKRVRKQVTQEQFERAVAILEMSFGSQGEVREDDRTED